MKLQRMYLVPQSTTTPGGSIVNAISTRAKTKEAKTEGAQSAKKDYVLPRGKELSQS